MSDRGSLANLKAEIQENIQSNENQAITGDLLQDVLVDCVDTMGVSVSQNTETGGHSLKVGNSKVAELDTFFNVNSYYDNANPYSGLGYAITLIPSNMQCLGLRITFLALDGWHIAQYKGDSLQNEDWTDTDNWFDALSEDIANRSKSLPSHNLNLFDISSKTNGCYMTSGTRYDGTNTPNAYLNNEGEVVSELLPHTILTDYYRPSGDRDIQLVRLNKLFPAQNASALSPHSINVALYDNNQNFVCGYILSGSCIIAVPRNYYLRTLHYSSDGNFDDVAYYDVSVQPTEKLAAELSDLANKYNTIIPFFETFEDAPLVSINDGGFIAAAGGVIENADYTYIIYDVSELSSVNIHIGKNRMWGAVIWTTFSALNDGAIDATKKVRNYVGTESDNNVPYNTTIQLQDNEKYLVIANRTEELDIYGYLVNYFTGYYTGKSAQKIEEELDELSASTDKTLLGKNIVALGDSITWQGGANCDQTKGWTYWVKNRLKPKSMVSYAWSGATWSNDANTAINDNPPLALDDDNTIWQQVRRLINAYNNNTQVKPDVIIIAAGINDVIALNRDERTGCLDKTAQQAFSDRSAYITSASVTTILTVADAIRYCFELLIQTFPNVQIILTTPLQSSYSEVDQTRWGTVTQIIEECAKYISANVIKQGADCGVYYTQEYLGHVNLSDGLHPNATGAEKIGNIISAKLRSMI